MFDDIKKHLIESLKENQALSAARIRGRVYPEVLVTDMAPPQLQAAAGPDRIAYLIGTEPLQIQIPNAKGIFKVNPCDIVFEAAGSYEKAFRAAMKKYGLRTLSDLDTPEEKKGFYNFVDRVWHSKEEKDKGEKKGTHKDEDAWDDPPELGGEPSLITPVEGEFTDGLKGKHDRMREKMRDDKERAREKDAKAAEQAKQQRSRDTDEAITYTLKGGLPKGRTYGVVKGDPKGVGEIVFKGNANKARSIVRALKKKGTHAYIVFSPKAEVGGKVSHQKGRGIKIEELPLYSDHQKSHKSENAIEEDLPLYSDYEKQHREGGKKKLERARPKKVSRGGSRGPVGINYHGRPFRLLPKKTYDIVVLEPKKEGVEPKLGQNNTANMIVLQRIYNLGSSEVATAMKLSAIKWGAGVYVTVDNEDGRRIGIGYSTDDNSSQSKDKRIEQDDLTLHRSIREKLFKLIFGKELKKKNVDFDVNEVSPPARRHQAKGIKKDIAKGKIPKTYVDKKTGKRKKTNPWAMAWAQYDKYGKPSSGPDKDSKTMKKVPKK